MNRKNTILIAIGIVASLATAPAQAETQAERLEVAKAYLAVSMKAMNLEKVALISARPILNQVRQKQPKLFAEKGTKLRTMIKTVLMESMQTAMANLDQKLAATFTLQELNALKEFFTSEIGRSVMEKMPQYMAAIQPAMQIAIQQSLPKLLAQLQKEGVKLR